MAQISHPALNTGTLKHLILTVRLCWRGGGPAAARLVVAACARPVVGRDGAAGAAVAPLALAADVGAGGVDEGGAPGLVLGEVRLVPRALAVQDAVELEGEDARLPLRRARHRHADPLCNQDRRRKWNLIGDQ